VTILAIRNGLAVLDGEIEVEVGTSLAVQGAAGLAIAQMRVLRAGPFPVARIFRVQAGVSCDALVGLGVVAFSGRYGTDGAQI